MSSKKLDKFAPDYKAAFLEQRRKISIKRKHGFWDAYEAATNTLFNTRASIASLGLCDDEALELALETGYVAEIDGRIVLTGKPLTPDMWRDEWLDLETGELLDKPRQQHDKQQQWSEPPILPNCKCRNVDQPSRSSWIFTGWETDGVKQLADYLEKDLGIPIWLKANGKNGNYVLTLPLWVQGELKLEAIPTWKEIEISQTTTETMEENLNEYSTTAAR